MPEQTDKKNIQIKEPDAPASEAQKSFIDDLAKAGVVTQEELTALGDAPTKQQASDLIEAHSSEEAFEDVQEARRAEREAARAEKSEDVKTEGDKEKAGFASGKIAAKFVTPHTYEAKDGRTFEKAYVKFPEGVNVYGIDLGGYSCDVFLNDRMKQQKLSGEMVTLSFKESEPVQIWTGQKGNKQYPYKHFEVDPWDLVTAIKAEREEFIETKAAERASLSQEAEQARDSSDALEGHEQSAHPEPSR